MRVSWIAAGIFLFVTSVLCVGGARAVELKDLGVKLRMPPPHIGVSAEPMVVGKCDGRPLTDWASLEGCQRAVNAKEYVYLNGPQYRTGNGMPGYNASSRYSPNSPDAIADAAWSLLNWAAFH